MADLSEAMAGDMGLLLAADGLAVTATYRGGGTGAGFSLSVICGDWADQLSADAGGYAGRARECAITARLSTITAAAALNRQPLAGDTVQIATGVRTGIWTVIEAVPDEGDGVTLLCRLRDIVEARPR